MTADARITRRTLREPPVALGPGRPSAWWGMLLLVATEGTLFVVLIATYFYLRFRAVDWPPRGVEAPAVLVPAILTAVLVATSVPMALAARAVRAGRPGAARASLAVALLVGAGYLAMQVHEFTRELERTPPTGSAYASIHHVLLGGHHAHVAIGLLLNGYLLLRLRGGLTRYRGDGVLAAALYWHFVNVLAVAVTATTLSAA